MRAWIHHFDTAWVSFLQSAPKWLRLPMVFITNVGQPATWMAATLFVVGMAFAGDDSRLVVAGLVVPATAGVTELMKLYWRRVRPRTEYVQNMLIRSYSFPSGHAAGAMVGCGFLAYLAWYSLLQPWAAVASITLVLLIFLIGISRIYVGAHFPSDVVGGWLVGGAGLAVSIWLLGQ